MVSTDGTITIAQTGTTSTSFRLPDWTMFAGMLFPDMDAGAITLQASRDGTNFYPVLDPVDGQALVVLASGSDPGWIDISDYIRFLPGNGHIRVVSATAQNTAAITIYWYCRG